MSINPEINAKKHPSKFLLATAVAKRARQIIESNPAKYKDEQGSEIEWALKEILDEDIKFEVVEESNSEEISIINELDDNLETQIKDEEPTEEDSTKKKKKEKEKKKSKSKTLTA